MRRNTVWYQINPHYFEQICLLKNWTSTLGEQSLFALIRDRLDYIKDLNCNGIWIMPLYERGQKNKKGFGSPYAVRDYQIEACWGTDEELKNLVEEAHQKGLKVICEYVPNHMAPDAPFLESDPEVCYRDENNQPFYDQDWSDTVKLNHSNPVVKGFTRANLIWLMKTYGFDGFRLDMAHYPLQGPSKAATIGSGDSSFWNEVLDNPIFKTDNFTLLAEVYDDRTQDCRGYSDHMRLLREGMNVYDKKTHDILARHLKYFPQHQSLQEKFYEELFIQAQALHSLGIDVRDGQFPFLRMPSNHDDCPGINNFGGLKQYILAASVLALVPGQLVVYCGDEYGHKVKPSVTGINYCDEHGNMTESNQVKLLREEDQEQVFEATNLVLALRAKENALQSGAILFAQVEENSGLSQSLLVFTRYKPETNEIILVAANFSPEEKWGKVKHFFPTFDFPSYQFVLTELLEWIQPRIKEKGYKLRNLKTSELSKARKFDEDFWIGLKPYEIQIFKFESVA